MKFIKRATLILLTLTVVGILFRRYIYRQLITYKSVGVRADYSITNEGLLNHINSNVDQEHEYDIEQIIKLSLTITSKHLNFTDDKNDINPNRLISSRTAHCVGYTSFFTTTCNHLFKQHNLNENWKARAQIGQIYFLGINLHKYFDSTFFKDHFAIIENKSTGQAFVVDPTINDYLDIDFVSYRSEKQSHQ